MATKYEVELKTAEDSIVLGYSARKTKRLLIEFAIDNAEKIKSLLSDSDLDADWEYSQHQGLKFGGGKVTIRFNSYTEKHPS